MKISIKIKNDTDNSYPDGELIIESTVGSPEVFIKISDDDREISVSTKELQAVLKMLAGE